MSILRSTSFQGSKIPTKVKYSLLATDAYSSAIQTDIRDQQQQPRSAAISPHFRPLLHLLIHCYALAQNCWTL